MQHVGAAGYGAAAASAQKFADTSGTTGGLAGLLSSSPTQLRRQRSISAEERAAQEQGINSIGSMLDTSQDTSAEVVFETANMIEEELNKALQAKHNNDMLETDHWFVDSTAFNAVIGILVILNTLQMGVETEYPDYEATWAVCETIFTALFLFEMIIKLYFLGRRYWFDGHNLLDGFIVSVSVLDLWVFKLVFGASSGSLQQLSILRVLRMARLVRVLRLIKHVQQLVVVIRGVVDAIMTTFWVACVLILTVYVGGIFCTEYVGRGTEDIYPGYTKEDVAIDDQEIMMNFNPYLCFGSLPMSMLTLFNIAIMSEWVEVVRPVSLKQPELTVFFICFVMFVTFGVMNVMVGMIVDNVFKEGTRLQDEEQQNERQKKLETLAKLRTLIKDIDNNDDGIVSVTELSEVMKSSGEDQMGNRGHKLKQLLKKVQIPAGLTPTELLCMLDTDGDGKLEYDEFVRSFYRLIESNNFQHMCIIQIGLNHVKNLVKVAHEEADSRLEAMEERILELTNEIKRPGTMSYASTTMGFDGGTGKRLSSDVNDEKGSDMEKEAKDGLVNPRDHLAALIKESQKSIEKKLMRLQVDFQSVGKEIRDQKYAALCQESRWEKEENDGLQERFARDQITVEANQDKQEVKRSQGSTAGVLMQPRDYGGGMDDGDRSNHSLAVPTPSISQFIFHRAVQHVSGCLDGYAALSDTSALTSASSQSRGIGQVSAGSSMRSRSFPPLQNGTSATSGDTPATSLEMPVASSARQWSKTSSKSDVIPSKVPALRRSNTREHAPLGYADLEYKMQFDVVFEDDVKTLGLRMRRPSDQSEAWRPEIDFLEADFEAHRRGIQVGDVIVAVNRIPTSGESRADILETLKNVRPLQLTLERTCKKEHVVTPLNFEPHSNKQAAFTADIETAPCSSHVHGHGHEHSIDKLSLG